ncbi:MAG: hypothetical protein SF053_18015 [Bacteroidia bacterium]|nr:hypothetical protein [Bacteroidia bacterium]
MKHILTCSLLLWLGAAHAQDEMQRQRFFWGVAAGPAYIRLQQPDEAVAAQGSLSFPNIKAGYMFTPRLAATVVLPGTVYRFTGAGRARDRGFEGIVPGIQYWPASRWWVQAGAGFGMDAPAFYDIRDATERRFYPGGAALAGVGYEIWQHRTWALDLQARVMGGSIRTPDQPTRGVALSLKVGITWY